MRGQPQLEHSRIRIGQPVILDQVFGHDVSRQHRAFRVPASPCKNRPLRNQRQISGLRLNAFTRNPPVISTVFNTTLNSDFISRSIKSSNTGFE